MNILVNDRGLRAGWRLAIYFVLVFLIGFLAFTALRSFVRAGAPASPYLMMLSEGLSFLIVFVPALIMAGIEKRPVAAYGLPARFAFGKLFWQGYLFGLAEVTALIGLIAAFHGYTFGAVVLHTDGILRWGAYWFIFFVLVGFFEEFAFRGYTQFTLADGIGFWPAALIFSALFGSAHLFNKGEGKIGAASVFMIGVIFAFALKRTGNLWFLVGWHAAFDFGETFLYSVPNSGQSFSGHLSEAFLRGPNWLTGGTVGPEGSVFSFITMALAAVILYFWFPAKPTDPLPDKS